MVVGLVKMVLKLILTGITVISLLLIIGRLISGFFAGPRTFLPGQVPVRRVAIVFGAGLWRNGTPTPILRDRVATAVELYFSGKVEKLLMSGDNRFDTYNEPAAMREYALSLGVPDEAIVLDFAGRRTYDTCYRARHVFMLTDAILVTQQFHLPRALITCNLLGLNAFGVPADKQEYLRREEIYWYSRELIATSVALWEVVISKPVPVLGDPEPIFPLNAE